MIGSGGTNPAPQITVEALEPTGGAQETAVPVWMALEHSEIGDGGTEVGAQTTDGCWLRGAIAADN